MNKLFVYGTLLNGEVQRRVYGRAQDGEFAELPDHEPDGLNVIEAKGERVGGLVLEVTDDELELIDRYENLGNLYKRVQLEVEPHGNVFVYQKIDNSIKVVV